jgi:HAE1 family hydrophobic/amphiphilic exporter-1
MDLETLYKGADAMQREMAKLDILRDVTSDMQLTAPNLVLHIDRDRAASLGVSVEQIQSALGSAFGSQQISTIYTPSEQYSVILEVQDKDQRDVSALNKLYVRARSGALVPLAAVADFKRETGPLTVSHLGQLPSVTVSFNLAPDVTLGTAIDAIRGVEQKISLPTTTITAFQGAAKAFKSSFEGMGLLLALALIAVYIVLGILYESFIHPLTILSGLPSAGVGALLTLLVFGVPLTLYAFVGIIMLIGIVKKNAIMMIDFALVAERQHGKGSAEAIREACLVRFRPIMMTTMAALMGALPIAFGTGVGAESRRPLGLTVVGGLLLSQVLTLYLTPVIYLYLDRLKSLSFYRRLAVLPEGTEPAAESGPSLDEAPLEEPRRARLRRVAGSDN